MKMSVMHSDGPKRYEHPGCEGRPCLSASQYACPLTVGRLRKVVVHHRLMCVAFHAHEACSVCAHRCAKKESGNFQSM